MLKVACFTGGKDVPSARFRVRQYVPALAHEGVEVCEMRSGLGQYPPRSRWNRPVWGIASLAANLPNILRSFACDVALFQREMISTLVTLEPIARKPRILDVDDAIFLFRGGRTAQKLAGLCETVICGNAFLAEWFDQFKGRVEILPTAVDVDRYVPLKSPKDEGPFLTIGWIGTSANFRYLAKIEDPLKRVLDLFPKARLRIVSDNRPDFIRIPWDRWDFYQWTQDAEVSQIQTMDIGLMPLEDSLWARGKCSFKMLQYMACGIPVVVSPVGMNAEVLHEGEVGFGARHTGEWIEALVALLRDVDLRGRMGGQGRAVVESRYSVKALAPRFALILKQAGGRT